MASQQCWQDLVMVTATGEGNGGRPVVAAGAGYGSRPTEVTKAGNSGRPAVVAGDASGNDDGPAVVAGDGNYRSWLMVGSQCKVK